MPRLLRWLLALSLGTIIGSVGCHRSPRAEESRQNHGPEEPVLATWYNVPSDSLARRRADLSELTAASDKLELGTLVRVTRITSGKSVVVRITDRGLHSRRSRLDLCKEAAEQLDMVGVGTARVRIEVLARAKEP